MILDKTQIIALAMQDLAPADRKNSVRLEGAFAAALEDLGLRLRSKGMLKSYTTTVAASTRSLSLSGENDDLKHIYALKWGSGENERVLEYVNDKQFLDQYDSSQASAGYPSKFTILGGDDGFPVVKFDVPTLIAESLLVYFLPELSPDNIGLARSSIALVSGTVAYFYGKGTEIGLPYYQQFKELAALSKSNQDFLEDPHQEMPLNKEDHNIRVVFRSMQLRRGV